MPGNADSNMGGKESSLNVERFKAVDKQLKKLNKEQVANQLLLNDLMLSGTEEDIKKQQDHANKLADDRRKLEEELEGYKTKLQDERNEKNKKALEEAWDNAGQTLTNSISSSIKDIKSTLESTMDSFISKQEAMAYGLTGTQQTLENVTKTFTKALGSTGVVKQEKVYENLSELIKSGIVFNSEQRAYLATIANDLGMFFDVSEGSLTRLINLQRQDLTDERMAIQYSLKQFLNSSYENSQYIASSFKNVSNALIEAQALMNASSAMKFEAAVQQWLGSMESVGTSTDAINNLATAIGQLGSGDLDVLSSDQMPLLAMAANNAGLSFGEILVNGLTEQTADALLKGVASYVSSIYESNSSNNVVLSELGKAFGIGNVSDIKAIAQVGDVTATGIIGNDITTLLNDMDDYLYTSTKINNSLANFIYEWAVSTASSDTNYLIYKLTDTISQATAALVSGVNIEVGILGNGVQVDLSKLISATPLLTTIPGLINSISGLKNAFGSQGSAQGIYDALAEGALSNGKQKLSIAGLFSNKSKKSGANVSGSMIYTNSDTTDIGTTAKTSATSVAETLYDTEEEQKTTDDIYELIGDVRDVLESFKTTAFGTYTKIVESDNTVTIGNDLSFINDMITFSALNIQNIYALLVEYLNPTNVNSQKVYDLDQINWSSPFDWYSSATGVNGSLVR